jgi:outer membrane lipoprotein SlyB
VTSRPEAFIASSEAASIGGLAGGGKGALIGAALGAGAGTAGAAYTGEKEIVLPAESMLSFKLTAPLTIKL